MTPLFIKNKIDVRRPLHGFVVHAKGFAAGDHHFLESFFNGGVDGVGIGVVPFVFGELAPVVAENILHHVSQMVDLSRVWSLREGCDAYVRVPEPKVSDFSEVLIELVGIFIGPVGDVLGGVQDLSCFHVFELSGKGRALEVLLH